MSTLGLKIKNVSKSISGVTIIDGVTAAHFPQGKVSALIGPNGAGKTTLFHLITGELRPDKGEITYGGKVISSLPPYAIARIGVGRLFQDVRLFENLTAFENVAAACHSPETENPWFPFLQFNRLRQLNSEIADKAAYWIDFVGLTDKKTSIAASLSYGQQKLLAIARLLAGNKSLLLLDEPTAGLSPVMAKLVIRLIMKILNEDKDKTIVIVEHNMSVILEVAYWVYFMHEGKIDRVGRTDHVLGNREIRELYLGL